MIPWQSAEFDGHEQVCSFADPCSGLKAIVAIHSTRLGPAVGGTRFFPYAEDRLALDDALRLSRAMTYKCALAGVPLGGGKGVIIGDPAKIKTERLLEAYGSYVNRIGGQFATGEDVGVTLADCEIMRRVSPYVTGTESGGAGDPSVHTAVGVFHGIRAVLKARLGHADLAGVHVAVQGLGHVGWHLCGLLHGAGARLTVADLEEGKTAQAIVAFDAQVAPPEGIHAVEAEVFAPCALGGTINERTSDAIRAPAIAGAANNQLASAAAGEALHRRGILFAPDYVINAGGLIGCAGELARVPGRHFAIDGAIELRLQGIHDRLLDVFAQAEAHGTTPEATADRMARELIAQ